MCCVCNQWPALLALLQAGPLAGCRPALPDAALADAMDQELELAEHADTGLLCPHWGRTGPRLA